ncbi:small conductance mechanosensitive channel [Cyclobacterium lianum]|uniref:Small conductance mechanosensitive channel n=1 Tax=Cyclobacterium lianum TaxID=388280 RepID=A0A1M7I636_9BACT|nr:mechanosensitive ion channel domain-containing protein [Cyclobacterium lianum]SHM36224.1 small conductance mechanosensitive channel [Cyclobacterium lianum]
MDMDTIDFAGMMENALPLILLALKSILIAVIIYFIGKWVINFTLKAIDKLFVKYDVDPSLSSFLRSFLKGLLYILLILAVLSTLGVEVTAFIAVLGAAGLAIGLALQGSLANFAGGILILIFKPFKVGDTIEAQGTLGSVENIAILYTTVRNFDNKVVTIPNGALANNSITNFSVKPTRRVEMAVGVAYGTDLKKTRQVILDTLKRDDRIHNDPAPAVYFTNFGDNSLDLSVRCWADADNLWPVYWDNMEAIKESLEGADIEVPFPQRDVHHFFPEGMPEKKG